MANIIHDKAKDGSPYAKMKSISPPMKNLTVPKPNRPFITFHLSSLKSTLDPIPVPDWIPPVFGKKVLAEIKSSEEYGRLAPI